MIINKTLRCDCGHSSARASPLTSLSIGWLLVLALINHFAPTESGLLTPLQNLSKLIPDKSNGKLFRTEFKIFLAKLNVRRVPLTKKHAERALSKLYKDEKVVLTELTALRHNMEMVDNNKRRSTMRILKIQESPKGDPNEARDHIHIERPRFSLSEVTQAGIDEWRRELAAKEAEYKELRTRIVETKKLIAHPDNYISIPNNYGRNNPERQRDLERDVLIKDREAMDWRRQVAMQEITPSWLEDEW